jgi:hypothetical protein
MKKVRVLLSFVKLSVAEKIVFFKNVIKLMTGNPKFPEPDVPLATLTTQTTALETATTNAKSGSHEAIALRKQAEEAAVVSFVKTAQYVDRIADGDPAVILGGGFQYSKQRTPVQRGELEAEPGINEGEILLIHKSVPRAGAYVWQYCVGSLPATDDGWILAGSSTQCRFTVRKLVSGSKCWFRACAVTPDGMGPWTDPIMKVVP